MIFCDEVKKCQTIKRRPEANRWDVEKVQATPWKILTDWGQGPSPPL